MASDTDSVSLLPTGDVRSIEKESTPDDADNLPPPSSQVTMPSTEAPGSPRDVEMDVDVNMSFKTELNDDRIASPPMIPSSLTPPPSTQQPNHTADGATIPHPIITMANGISSSQAFSLVSPPATVPATLHRTFALADEYAAPTAPQLQNASPEELRDMLVRAAEEQSRLAKEVAGYRFRVAHLTMQEDELAERTTIELDATRCEVAMLRDQVQKLERRREADAAKPNVSADYAKLLSEHAQLKEENSKLQRKLKAAKKIIQEKDDANAALVDDKDALLTRLRENREHMHQLRSPGRILHQALTPKHHHHHSMSTPQHARTGMREPPRTAPPAKAIDYGQERISGGERFSALLSVLNQENTSAPSTPVLAQHASSRHPPKHTRNVQSLSSLPTTPLARPHGLLPSVDLVPQTEPRRSLNPLRPSIPASGPAPGAGGVPVKAPPPPPPVARGPAKSRESTISAEEDNQELARQALQQVDDILQAAAAAGQRKVHEGGARESRASQEASQMLRRDPRESFEAPEKTASGRTPLKMFAPKGSSTGEKRKHEEEERPRVPEGRRGLPTSPKRTKLPDGLGIKYGR